MHAMLELGPLAAYTASRFGDEASHLDVIFDEPGPALITTVLGCALYDKRGQRPGVEQLWQASIGGRLQALIAVARATRGDTLYWQQSCQNARCRSPMEMDLDLAGIGQLQDQVRPIITVDSDCGTLRLRLPTGSDQLRWRKLAATDPDALTGVMAKDLLVSVSGKAPAEDWQLPAACFREIEDRLEEADPLTVFKIVVECPECGEQQSMDCDLEPLLLTELRHAQARLFDEVDRLASHYHWSEADILAMTPQRRQQYLERLDRELWQ